MGVSKNRGTSKWMVKIRENPIKVDDLGGFPIIFGNILISFGLVGHQPQVSHKIPSGGGWITHFQASKMADSANMTCWKCHDVANNAWHWREGAEKNRDFPKGKVRGEHFGEVFWVRWRDFRRSVFFLCVKKGSASVVPADSDSVVPADSVSVVPAAVWVVRSTTVPQWHLKQITYWRSRIAHAAYTSWSWWHWCCKKIYSIERKCNVQVKPCSVLIWYCRKSMPHFNVSSVNTLRMGCRSDLLHVIITAPPHPAPPFGLMYPQVCLVPDLYVISTAPPHPTPPFGLMYPQVCLAADLYVISTTPPHPTPPL